MRKPSKTRLKKELDKLVQQKLVPLNPQCFVCGGKTSEMHHYVQKRMSLYLRYDYRNLIPLCKACHCSHHRAGNPRIHQMIIKKKGHEWADEIEILRRKIFKDSINNLKELKEQFVVNLAGDASPGE